MLRTDALLGDFETVTSVAKRDDGELLRLVARGAPSLLVFVPESEERGTREVEMLELLRYPGIPVCSRSIAASLGASALVFEAAGDARPLCDIHDFPEPTLRAGLTSLLAAINFVHSRGIVHRRIDRTQILADASGQFWLIGWADARPVPNAPPVAGALSPVATDLHDLARAFSEALLRRPWPDPESASVHVRGPRTAAGMELLDAGVKIDRDCARVLSRLVTSDPRDAYTGATDVLADLGATAITAFDPWENVRPIGMRREVARVLRLLDHTRLPASETVTHASSVDYMGPSGAGKSRLLMEIARAARAQNAIVLTAEGGARGAWGGVGVLCRQLVQLLGRGARMCLQHEDAIRHLLGEPDSSPSREPQPLAMGVDGGDPLISSCTAAMTDLVRMAFRHTPGLLLLDDEEHLPRAARDVWRATGHFVQVVNGGGGVFRALLVSASTRSHPAELGSDRITVELRPWRQRDVDKFLARAFASPAGARDVSLAIHRVAGGRPGDVVAYLRELERAGTLRREGLRWRLDAPLPSLPPLAGSASDRIRRSLEAAGRDATLLVECLAVARDVPLARSALAELADLHGPRLAAAADSAIAAGLLVVDGTSWRVRTDAIAHKVRGALPTDRCRILHREVLNLLLDSTPPDTHPAAIHAVATHARASADPRAEAWTRQAISRAQSEGEWLLALEHLDDAAGNVGGWFADDEALTLRASQLLSLGRLGEAIDALQGRVWSSYSSADIGIAALCLLARAYYEARDWRKVLELSVPDTVGDPDTLAHVRFLRAAAMRHLGQVGISTREARLAVAELAGPPSTETDLARLEYEYQQANYRYEWKDVRRALVSKLRLDVRERNDDRMAMDLAKLGNAARYLAKNVDLAHSIIVRGIGIARDGKHVGGQARSALYGTLGYTSATRQLHRRALRHFSRSAFYAIQTGAVSLATSARLRLVSCAVATGRVRYEDKLYVRSFAEADSSALSMAVLSACVDLGMCYLYFGHQNSLERLADSVERECGSDRRYRVLLGFSIVGRMWLDEDLSDIRVSTTIGNTPRELSKCLIGCRVGDLWISSIAYSALRPEYVGDRWLEVMRDRALSRLVKRSSYPGWGNVAVALGVALWIPVQYDPDLWKLLVGVVRKHNGPLPVALEWQRVVLESREARRLCDWNRAEILRASGEAQLRILLGSEYGARGLAAYERWSSRTLTTPESSSPSGPVKPDPARLAVTPSARYAITASDLLPTEWLDTLARVREPGRMVVISLHARELELLGQALAHRSGVEAVVLTSGTATSDARLARSGALIIHAPELWQADQINRVRDKLRSFQASSTVITLLTMGVSDFRALGPAQRALAELIDGEQRTLRPICEDRGQRSYIAQAVLCPSDASEAERQQLVSAFCEYSWPGGLAEVERVAEQISRQRVAGSPSTTLANLEWKARLDLSEDRVSSAEARVLRALRETATLGIRSLATEAQIPTRSMLRLLSGLILRERIVREGRGRATRYRLAAEKLR